MPIIHHTPVSVAAMNFNIDADLDMGAHVLKADHVQESTVGHGVEIDQIGAVLDAEILVRGF